MDKRVGPDTIVISLVLVLFIVKPEAHEFENITPIVGGVGCRVHKWLNCEGENSEREAMLIMSQRRFIIFRPCLGDRLVQSVAMSPERVKFDHSIVDDHNNDCEGDDRSKA